MNTGRFGKLEKDGNRAGEPGSGGSTPPSVASGGAEASAAEYYPSFLREAEQAFFAGKYRDAMRHYSRAAAEDPTQVTPWIGQLSCMMELRQFREAELWSNRALDLFPEEPSLLSQRARLLALTGNIKRAMGASDYALSKGASTWVWLARAEVLLEAGDSNAFFCAQKAMELSSRDEWQTPALLGRLFANKRQWSTANEYLLRATDLNPSNHFLWYELARVQMAQGRTELVRDSIARCINLQPDYRPARELEGKLYATPLSQRFSTFFWKLFR
jgi:Flp pilus assembly protein TadD